MPKAVSLVDLYVQCDQSHDYRQVLFHGTVILDAARPRTVWADLSVDWLVGWRVSAYRQREVNWMTFRGICELVCEHRRVIHRWTDVSVKFFFVRIFVNICK